MAVDPGRIDQSLRKGVAPLYMLLGEEPLQTIEAADAIRAAAREQGFDERTVLDLSAQSDWSALDAALRDRSLFASRTLVDLRLATGKPGREGGEKLKACAAAPQSDTVLLLQLPRPDRDMRRAAWFKAMESAAVVVHARPVPPERLDGWIRERLTRHGLRITDEALQLLAARVEGNLLAARQEIEKLALAGVREIDLETLSESTADAARFDLFGLSAAALRGETGRALRMLEGLLDEGQPEPLILWALARDARLLVQALERRAAGANDREAFQGSFGDQQKALRLAAGRLDVARARDILRLAARVDRVIKGQEQHGDARQGLLDLVARMAGRPLTVANPVLNPEGA
ncbi:DNA polymerase III subunit delta [Thioalkalivibrio sp. AKL17]|uniref:DNA polymerase III subunit delta n=1 Tax=Thioalkalivibrio sp. AKL17 TaxID=1158160 RepID=UPI000379D8D7|nr:DNA polymerase III subunit delta [Thioalkalivibrio sp. AKL17]